VIDGVHTTWQVEHWCKNLDDVDKALSVPYEPIDYDISDYTRIKQEVGDHGIIMATIADPLWLAADLMEFGEYTIWAMMETEHFAKTVEIMHERAIENLKRQLEVCVVDLYRIAGPEYATPPFLPPRFFQQFVVPYVSEITELIHSKGAKVRIHSHGKIGQVLDMILDTGVDAIDPCEAPPDGDIPLAEIKERVGQSMCIFGNIQLKLLEAGTPEMVAEEVRICMRAAKEGGGFVIMPTAAPIDTPLSSQTEENYFSFIDTALEFGQY
jgi:uroporphyrinogen decarboxylase